ncbi:glycerol-3-phosphate dehydrogenase/oxidase [Couchioplanes caeruleus]|uniref:Glycerol-3-phosphate dehydrogenase n=2 Tax=Couchioplanes caeruleus TaxID=56438 RepID=A0A1K0GLS9_9ACTN|nr:glycerol-3-phosphate dehydrogenase/oxidase [Couchioplanes caeruleus]OJF11980.1 glycerol-3-phosphate dehydrogenase [Couchioplanes caeruleus subsp. caeruleus]ROP29818.1 glycerol-3-phosphate dehydrogenase [Couchioplanes caeruleus]
MYSATLSPAARERSMAVLGSGEELDVLVIGGGVTGAGCALDAVTRGLSVGLVEARDWASGTSSRSSKLIHGGLRYLEMLDFGLVREALRERGLLVQRLAPHLVHPVPFLYPLRHRGWERLYAGAGVLLYDTMGISSGNARGVPGHRHLSRRGALRACPSLRPDALTGALQYYDAQVDDARLVTFLVRTAAQYGAHPVSRARVVGFLRDGARVVGARVHDLETDKVYEVRARQVINATGVWTDDTQALLGEQGHFQVRASKGIHLVVPRGRIKSDTGLILRTDKSVLFVIPWGRHWLIGTTDTDWDLSKAHPAATSSDIDYLLDRVNEVLADPLTRDDVEGVYAGLRPLVSGESELTAKLSREHSVATPAPGLVVIAGGKYTTYRVMARDAVDQAVRGLGGGLPASCTDRLPLLGAEGYVARWNQRRGLAQQHGMPVQRMEHLLRRYGTAVDEVLELLRDDPTLAEPLEGAEDYLRVEVVYAVTAEGARHLEDVLTRRTHISIETFDRGLLAARGVAGLMAEPLGWTAEQVDLEVAHYTARVQAERAAHEQPDDESADAARSAAPEVVPTAALSA